MPSADTETSLKTFVFRLVDFLTYLGQVALLAEPRLLPFLVVLAMAFQIVVGHGLFELGVYDAQLNR